MSILPKICFHPSISRQPAGLTTTCDPEGQSGTASLAPETRQANQPFLISNTAPAPRETVVAELSKQTPRVRGCSRFLGPGPPQPRKKKDLSQYRSDHKPAVAKACCSWRRRDLTGSAAAAQHICELSRVIEGIWPASVHPTTNPWWRCHPEDALERGRAPNLMYDLPRNRAVAQTRTPRMPFWPTESGVKWAYQGKLRAGGRPRSSATGRRRRRWW